MEIRERVYDVLVIGGGVNGLSSLYHVGRFGYRNSALVERFSLGHKWGSSHGEIRMTRSTYVSTVYTFLVQIVNTEEWPRLEADAGTQLVHRTPGCFFGISADIAKPYEKSSAEAGAKVEWLGRAEAQRKFPQLRFKDTSWIFLDHTAGVIAAGQTMSALHRLCRKNGLDILEETRVIAIDPSQEPIRVETDRGTLKAERLIVTAGPWSSDLFPFLRPKLKVIRQTVAYFEPDGPPSEYGVGRFPVWMYLGEKDKVYYGLPEFGSDGIKVSRHVTSGNEDDPNNFSVKVDSSKIRDLHTFVAGQLTAPIRRFVRVEHCLYTNTETENFILDVHPENSRIAIGAGFSGHGFKFGPLTGRILAELVLYGKTSIQEFEQFRSIFTISLE